MFSVPSTTVPSVSLSIYDLKLFIASCASDSVEKRRVKPEMPRVD